MMPPGPTFPPPASRCCAYITCVPARLSSFNPYTQQEWESRVKEFEKSLQPLESAAANSIRRRAGCSNLNCCFREVVGDVQSPSTATEKLFRATATNIGTSYLSRKDERRVNFFTPWWLCCALSAIPYTLRKTSATDTLSSAFSRRIGGMTARPQLLLKEFQR